MKSLRATIPLFLALVLSALPARPQGKSVLPGPVEINGIVLEEATVESGKQGEMFKVKCTLRVINRSQRTFTPPPDLGFEADYGNGRTDHTALSCKDGSFDGSWRPGQILLLTIGSRMSGVNALKAVRFYYVASPRTPQRQMVYWPGSYR